MRFKIIAASLLITFNLSSCAIHDNFPYICFLKKCVETQKIDRQAKRKARKGKQLGAKKMKHKKSTESTEKAKTKEFVK